jgi:hypothetical protein
MLDPPAARCRADLRSHAGFLPLRVHGAETGFEYYFDELDPGDVPVEAEKFGSHAIVARTGGNFEEGRAALLFLKVAARLAGGAYVEDDHVVPPDDVEAHLGGLIQLLDRSIE